MPTGRAVVAAGAVGGGAAPDALAAAVAVAVDAVRAVLAAVAVARAIAVPAFRAHGVSSSFKPMLSKISPVTPSPTCRRL